MTMMSDKDLQEYEDNIKLMKEKEMKPWQKGFDLDYLKKLEKNFNSYNEYAQHELSKFKKNNIAEALSRDNIQLIGPALIAFTLIPLVPKSLARYLTLASRADLQTPITL